LSRSNKKIKKEVNKKVKDQRLRDNANPKECRSFQLEGLLGWKNYDVKEEVKKGEYEYHEFDDITAVNMEKYAEDLQAILINPPWSNKAPKFDFNKFSKLKLSLNKMKEGLIFVWTDKEYISDMIYFFENQDIKYVENMVWVTLDPNKKSMYLII
jgi:hypothetical protein